MKDKIIMLRVSSRLYGLVSSYAQVQEMTISECVRYLLDEKFKEV
jgi:macrodomain Ter protein organizer (MatP/YcbG family)